MSLVFACISPHGAEVIPELAGRMLDDFAVTREGLRKLASMMKRQNPETIVLATPHNLRLEGNIGVVTSEFTEGTLKVNDKMVELRCACDRRLVREILEKLVNQDFRSWGSIMVQAKARPLACPWIGER